MAARFNENELNEEPFLSKRAICSFCLVNSPSVPVRVTSLRQGRFGLIGMHVHNAPDTLQGLIYIDYLFF